MSFLWRAKGRLHTRTWTRQPVDEGGRRLRRGSIGSRIESLEDRRLLSTWIVNSVDDTVIDDFSLTLREAVDLANNSPQSDLIKFDPSLMDETIGLTSPLDLTDMVGHDTIEGLYDYLPITSGGQLFRVHAGANVTMIDMDLQGGFATDGGAIWNAGTLTLQDMPEISGGHATRGGAIYNSGSISMSNVQMRYNTAEDGGAIYQAMGGSLSLDRGTWIGWNSATGSGGAIYQEGGTVSGGGVIAVNTATDGAGIFMQAGTLELHSGFEANNGTVGGNQATGRGGGIYIGPDATVITDGLIDSNMAANGGAIYVAGGSLELQMFGSVVNNTASQSGGAIYVAGGTVNSSVLIQGNRAADGGAIYLMGGHLDQRFPGSIQNNRATGYGGGIYLGNGTSADLTNQVSDNAAAVGGAIANFGGQVSLDAAMLDGNSATLEGGGIACGRSLPVGSSPGIVTLVGSTLSHNTAGLDGGALNNFGGQVLIQASIISDNGATGNGGGISNTDGAGAGSMQIEDSLMERNSAGVHGGGIFTQSLLVLIDTDIAGNRAMDGEGGGIACTEVVTTLSMTGGSLRNNLADTGGGLWVAGNATLVGVEISGNSVRDSGGGLENAIPTWASGTPSVTLTDCLVVNNSAHFGGGLHNQAYLTMTGGRLQDNGASNGAGAENAGTMSLTRVLVDANRGTVGAGLENSAAIGAGSLSVNDCTITRNVAAVAVGGILNVGELLIEGSYLADNQGNLEGGAIYNSGMLRATNCTLADNVAQTGGGIDVYRGSALVIHTTIANNGYYGVVAHPGTTVALSHTIVALNGAGDVLGTIDASSDHNLIGDGTGMVLPAPPENGNMIGTYPFLAGPADYGGPTWTYALLPASPAIDKGVDGGLYSKDQRGLSRVDAADIGAFESQHFNISIVTGPRYTTVGTAFPGPITAHVAANNPREPVAGGWVDFRIMSPGGATATLSNQTPIDASGYTQIDAMANGIAGRYLLGVSCTGSGIEVRESLYNLPHVVDFQVRWGTVGVYSLPIYTAILPWIGIDRFMVRFDQPFPDVVGADIPLIGLTGQRFGDYLAGAGLTYQASTRTAIVTLAPGSVIGSTNWDAVMQRRGDRMDFWFGTSGRSFAVLPGDYNRDGVVNSTDQIGVRNESYGIAPLTIFSDMDGDGVVDRTLQDYKQVSKRVGWRL